MATSESTVEYLLDQCGDGVTARKMFGEYALYKDQKVVALVCDDTLFVKMTGEGKKFVGEYVVEGKAYPGAKLSMVMNEERIEDREWLQKLLRITAAHVAPPKPKAVRTKRRP